MKRQCPCPQRRPSLRCTASTPRSVSPSYFPAPKCDSHSNNLFNLPDPCLGASRPRHAQLLAFPPATVRYGHLRLRTVTYFFHTPFDPNSPKSLRTIRKTDNSCSQCLCVKLPHPFRSRTYPDLSGPIRTYLDLSGPIWTIIKLQNAAPNATPILTFAPICTYLHHNQTSKNMETPERAPPDGFGPGPIHRYPRQPVTSKDLCASSQLPPSDFRLRISLGLRILRFEHCRFEFRICFGLRISDFEIAR